MKFGATWNGPPQESVGALSHAAWCIIIVSKFKLLTRPVGYLLTLGFIDLK